MSELVRTAAERYQTAVRLRVFKSMWHYGFYAAYTSDAMGTPAGYGWLALSN